MRAYSDPRIRRQRWSALALWLSLLLVLASALPVFATKGVFQGLVVEGTERDVGRYIYVAGRGGFMRRVNIQRCRVRFGADVPASQRVQNASQSLKDSAEVRVTAEQGNDGVWIASDIVILKLPHDRPGAVADLGTGQSPEVHVP